jgi:UDP-N-acetylmuramate--alanine ligase
MKDEFIDCFARYLGASDVLVMPEPAYFGGTVDRSIGSADIAAGIIARGHAAEVFADRARCGEALAALARPGDRIVIMGARDDTLSLFAEDLLATLRQRQSGAA